jgi:AbrB family looped-hinge helix DNA binding protein
MKERATVSEKGRVTIPKALRDSLGITTGSELAFEERDGRLVATRVDAEDPVLALRGLGDRRGVDVDALLAEMRGPAWSPELDSR